MSTSIYRANVRIKHSILMFSITVREVFQQTSNKSKNYRVTGIRDEAWFQSIKVTGNAGNFRDWQISYGNNKQQWYHQHMRDK